MLPAVWLLPPESTSFVLLIPCSESITAHGLISPLPAAELSKVTWLLRIKEQDTHLDERVQGSKDPESSTVHSPGFGSEET